LAASASEDDSSGEGTPPTFSTSTSDVFFRVRPVDKLEQTLNADKMVVVNPVQESTPKRPPVWKRRLMMVRFARGSAQHSQQETGTKMQQSPTEKELSVKITAFQHDEEEPEYLTNTAVSFASDVPRPFSKVASIETVETTLVEEGDEDDIRAGETPGVVAVESLISKVNSRALQSLQSSAASEINCLGEAIKEELFSSYGTPSYLWSEDPSHSLPEDSTGTRYYLSGEEGSLLENDNDSDMSQEDAAMYCINQCASTDPDTLVEDLGIISALLMHDVTCGTCTGGEDLPVNHHKKKTNSTVVYK
jgi:hypothetical protein